MGNAIHYQWAGRRWRLALTRHGDPANPRKLICVHGLTRLSRDFDFLAAALDRRYDVLCPDMPGRGQSDWLPDAGDYAFPAYLAALDALLAELGTETVDWVGTSMGGLLGMALAARQPSPVARLVLNDIGAFVPRAALQRIAGYVAQPRHFDTCDEVERYLREVYAGFGPLTNAEWRHLAEHSVRRTADGRLTLHYDPLVGEAFVASAGTDLDLWPLWQAVRCPVLVLRGTNSDVLDAATAQRMASSGSSVQVVEIPATGHAPALLAAGQIGIVADWLADSVPLSPERD